MQLAERSKAAWRIKKAIGAVILLSAGLAWIGCDGKDWPEPAEQLPGWVYDSPYYYQPQPENELKALDAGLDGQIPHFYTRDIHVPIRRPDSSPAAKTPNLAVFWSDDHGAKWHKAGYFGVDQMFFVFVAPGEGDYEIRFAGPGVDPSRLFESTPPHRVYHVDTTPPNVITQIDPVKPIYQPGETIHLSWTVTDANIDPNAQVVVYQITLPNKVTVIPSKFPLNGSLELTVPDAAAEGVRYAVEAVDKAGNIGRGCSLLIQSVAPTSQPEVPAAQRTTPLPTPVIPPSISPEPPPLPKSISPEAPPLPPSLPTTIPVPAGTAPTSMPAPANGDSRLPLIAPPAMPLDLPAIRPSTPPASQPAADKAIGASARPLDPLDRAVDSSYQPKLYPPAASSH